MVDFNTHSNVSDGDLSPALLIKEAVKQGLNALALTDHDTIKGLESARISAQEENFKFIPGIEININWVGGRSAPGLGPGGEFHLLGLGITSPTPGFLSSVEELSRRREERNREIFERIHELSIDAEWEELSAFSSDNKCSSSLGRPHFASLLVKKNIVKNIDQAFARYLGAGKPLYVPIEGLNFEEAVAIIRESGGIPVLAHPISLYVAWGRLPGLIKTLKEMGLMGLEAWHPIAKPGSCRRLEELAKSLGLYITEGSDYHGFVNSNRRLGFSGRGRKIEDSILDAIPELK